MKRNIKGTVFFIATVLLVGRLVPGCLLTDGIGLRPPDSVPAAEVKQRLRDEAGLGFILGCEYYLARKSGLGVDCRDVSSFRSGVALAYFLAPVFAGVQDGSFYRRPSVAACAEHAFNRAFLFAHAYLSEIQKSTSVPGLKLPASDNEYKSAAVFSAFGARDCGLRRTGKLLELGEPLGL